jgi:PKD repeat protein
MGNCTATDEVTVNVGSITANAGADQSICTGQTATLTASGGGSYLWSNNLGTNATVTTPALSQTTTYSVTVTMGNCTATDQVTITLLPLPAAAFTSNISGAQVSFTNTSSNADSYDWDFGDGNVSIETSPGHTYENNDVYTVSLIANNECGADTAYETVEIIIINTNDLSGQIIFGLYPNPNYGQFTMVLSGNSAQVVTYKMTNVLGQVLDEQFLSLNGGNLTKDFDYPNIVAGSYFITLSSGGKSVFKKIIVY